MAKNVPYGFFWVGSRCMYIYTDQNTMESWRFSQLFFSHLQSGSIMVELVLTCMNKEKEIETRQEQSK